MSPLLAIHVPGEPVGKGRPRVTRSGIAYTPARTRQWEEVAATIARAHWRRQPVPRSTPVHVSLVAVHHRPKRLQRRTDPDGRIPHSAGGSQPDLDNIVKAALDALQRAEVLADDCCVASIAAVQVYAARGESAHLELVVSPWTG